MLYATRPDRGGGGPPSDITAVERLLAAGRPNLCIGSRSNVHAAEVGADDAALRLIYRRVAHGSPMQGKAILSKFLCNRPGWPSECQSIGSAIGAPSDMA